MKASRDLLRVLISLDSLIIGDKLFHSLLRKKKSKRFMQAHVNYRGHSYI